MAKELDTSRRGDGYHALTPLPRVPEPQHVERRLPNLATHLIAPHQDATHLARLELLKLLADARMLQKPCGRRSQRLSGTQRGLAVDRAQELVKPYQIGQRPRCPFQLHPRGAGSGLSVPRLSAQACTA